MESPPKLGLGTIYIQRLYGRTDLYQGMSPEFRYRDGKVLGTPPHSTPPVSRPPLIVFQILILSQGFLIYFSKLTHTNLHLTSKHGKYPTLIHSIKTPPFIQQNIYPRVASTSQNNSINKVSTSSISQKSKLTIMTSTKHILHVHQPYHAYHPNKIHVHVIKHDLPHLLHCTITPRHLCINACSSSHECSCDLSKHKP